MYGNPKLKNPCQKLLLYLLLFEGYKKFLNTILELPDVWIVPIKDGIEYMKAGNVTNDQLVAREFAPFSCDEPTKPENCPGKKF